jgi:hypothetical protein
VSLTPGAGCPPFADSGGISPAGILGEYKSSVVCAKAKALHDGFEITYKVLFRELKEQGVQRGYKIDLVKHASSAYTSDGKTIRISRESVQQTLSDGKTLIITEMKIHLA